MPLVPAICTQCGSPIQVDDSKEAGICPHCGTAFITEKVVNNYVTNHVSNTTVTQNIVKNVYGREKTEAEEYVARGLSFLDIGEYLDAAKCFESAVKREPGKIENHILLYRALTLDFRLYYGGLTDPERQGYAFAFPLNEQDKEKKTSLNEVFDRIDKLAAQQDISALQKQYGYTFRKDKNFWLESYRNATRLYKGILEDKPSEISQKLEKILDAKPSVFQELGGDFRRFDRCAAYAIENLYALPDFSEKDREAFFEEYRRDYTDTLQLALQRTAKAQAEYMGTEASPVPELKDALQILTYKIFPCRNGVYDLTGYAGPIIAANVWAKDTIAPDLRLSADNMRLKSLSVYRSQTLQAKNCHLAGKGRVDLSGVTFRCETLTVEEGITEIVKADLAKSELLFQNAVFPDSLEVIGSGTFTIQMTRNASFPEITFGKGLKRIENKAFCGVTNERKNSPFFKNPLVLPEGLEYLGEKAFSSCSQFNLVVLPASLKETGDLPFDDVYAMLVCLCDISRWNDTWHSGKRYSTVFNKIVDFSYNYFDVPRNICYYDFPVPKEKWPEYRKQILPCKQFANFDENKTRFAEIKKIPEKKSGCYIATAVYGSYDCPQVWTLRRNRDFSLARSAPGRLFIRVYYALSPTLVKLFGKQRWFCAFWKRILDKKVCRLNRKGIDDSPYRD